jgi:hypothetical protein
MRTMKFSAGAVLFCVAAFASSPVRAADPEPETYSFLFERTPWDDVLAWYAKITGLKADVRAKPVGPLTLKPPKNKRFTVAEITDLLNEALPQQKLLLIPHHKSFAVVRADEKIDPKLIPRVEYKDLHKWGKTAVVEVALPVELEIDEDIKDQLKKFLSPVGEVVSAKGKSIVLRETVENILRFRELLRPL